MVPCMRACNVRQHSLFVKAHLVNFIPGTVAILYNVALLLLVAETFYQQVRYVEFWYFTLGDIFIWSCSISKNCEIICLCFLINFINFTLLWQSASGSTNSCMTTSYFRNDLCKLVSTALMYRLFY